MLSCPSSTQTHLAHLQAQLKASLWDSLSSRLISCLLQSVGRKTNEALARLLHGVFYSDIFTIKPCHTEPKVRDVKQLVQGHMHSWNLKPSQCLSGSSQTQATFPGQGLSKGGPWLLASFLKMEGRPVTGSTIPDSLLPTSLRSVWGQHVYPMGITRLGLGLSS